jgi:hypothetical protein
MKFNESDSDYDHDHHELERANNTTNSNNRRKKDNHVDSQPLFLRKAFHMITNCPEEIAGWSTDGDSFIVRDVDKFAAEVIPTVYKHNKFSSFVRQLNFCKFKS